MADNEEVTKPTRVRGKIIHIALDKGWGFISSRDIKFTRIFFHWSALGPLDKFQELHKGMEVEFTPMEIPNQGYRAIKIEVIK